VFQNNFLLNLHHFLRAEASHRGRGLPLRLPLATLGTDEQRDRQAIFADLQTYWLPYLSGHGDLDEALSAVVKMPRINFYGLNDNPPVHVSQALLGHASSDTVMIYV
jgi:hypothetical protein